MILSLVFKTLTLQSMQKVPILSLEVNCLLNKNCLQKCGKNSLDMGLTWGMQSASDKPS